MSENSTIAADNAGPQRTDPPVDVSLPTFERVQAFIVAARSGKYVAYSTDHLDEANATLIAATASPSSATFTMTVVPSLCNPLGNLHGGAAATIFDHMTTCAVVPLAKKGYWEWVGLSRHLSCTYLRPLPIGEKITIYSEVVHAGRRLLTVKGEIRDSKGRLAVTCEHLKFSVDPEVTGGPIPLMKL